jgi:hypothetical protein
MNLENQQAAEASAETEAAVAQQKTDRQVFKKSSNSFSSHKPATDTQLLSGDHLLLLIKT